MLPRSREALRAALMIVVFEASALDWLSRRGTGLRVSIGLTVAGRKAAGLMVASRMLSGRKSTGRVGSGGLALRRGRRRGASGLRRGCSGRRRLGSAQMQAEGRGRA